MFVRHQNGIQASKVFANRGKPLGYLATAEPGVNQQTGSVGGYKRRVPGAAAREYADLNDTKLLYQPLCTGLGCALA